MTKIELRERFRKLRQDFVLSKDNSTTAALQGALDRRLADAGIIYGTIGGYAAMKSEFDPHGLLESGAHNGHAIALPYFADRSAEMQFRQWDGKCETGPFGIAQPASENPIASPDTVLVPLVAADCRGNRIGQGQGHYDRFLTNARRNGRILAIGLAWECQIADTIPADSWDEPLDYIATPDRIIEVTS